MFLFSYKISRENRKKKKKTLLKIKPFTVVLKNIVNHKIDGQIIAF